MAKAKFLIDGTLSEESMHQLIIEYISKHPELSKFRKFIMHFPNEGKRSPRYGALMRSLGLRKGVADLFIAIAKNGYHGAWIELKSQNGVLSSEQKTFLMDMTEQGYYTATCHSFDFAIDIITRYLS